MKNIGFKNYLSDRHNTVAKEPNELAFRRPALALAFPCESSFHFQNIDSKKAKKIKLNALIKITKRIHVSFYVARA